MREFAKQIISELEELKEEPTGCYGISCVKCPYDNECVEGEKGHKLALDKAIKIIDQLAGGGLT